MEISKEVGKKLEKMERNKVFITNGHLLSL